MSGFDDDFGEMVGDKEAPPPVVEEVLAADDPAAEFLAREQEQLGDLEADIGPLSGTFDINYFHLIMFGFSVTPKESNYSGKESQRGAGSYQRVERETNGDAQEEG